MHRLLLIAIGLTSLLWAADARTRLAGGGDVFMMSAATPGQAADAHGRSDSDKQWQAQQHTLAAVTASPWKSAPVHAALAAAVSPRSFDAARAASSPDPPVRSPLPYLRHTPLLI